MNQEELINIKAIARLMPESQARNHILLLLAHIDAQAGQIEALKERLVEERAKTIATQELRESPEQAEEIGMRVTAGFSELPAWMTDHYRDVARQQLAEELPEAFRDG